jgi:surfeit locus 1 family protein
VRTSTPAEPVARGPSWPLDLAAGLVFLLLFALGTWQWQRMQWKEELIAYREQRLAEAAVPLPAEVADWSDLDFRKLEVRGTFAHEKEQLMGVSKHRGRLGRQLLTPLLTDDGRAVLVDRGWVPEDQTHPAARPESQPTGSVTIRGIARYRGDDEPAWMTPDNQPDEAVWYWYDMAALRAATGEDLLPVVIEADARPNRGGLPVGGRTRTELPNRHLQYVVTWYGLALALAGVYIAFRVKRAKEQS